MSAKLREAEDYRSFLRQYLAEKELSLSDFARATNFGRGFPGDVLSGKRRLTGRSFYAFEKALKVPAVGKRIFRLLVAREEPDIFPAIRAEAVEGLLRAQRKKPWNAPRRETTDSQMPAARRALQDSRAARIFAAAGSPEEGATFAQLASRTRLPAPELEAQIKRLENAKILALKDGLYYPQELHLFLQATDQKALFVDLFREACRGAQARVETSIASNEEMFFTSTFCVHEKKLPELKEALRRTMLEYVDENVEAQGDSVVRIVTALNKF